MTRVALHAEQRRRIGVVALEPLQECGHLARVRWVDPRVAFSGREQDRRVSRVRAGVVIRRVGAEPLELRRVLGRSVLGDPEARDEEVLIPEHVEERHRAHDRRAEIGPLGHRGAHEQATVGAAGDPKTRAARPAPGHQRIRGRREIVEDVLLVPEHPGAMPTLAELGPAAQVRDDVESAGVGPGRGCGAVRRGPRHVEAAVPGEDRWHVTARRDVAAMHEEHRDLRAVLRPVRLLIDGDRRGVEGRRELEARDLGRRPATPVDDDGRGRRREGLDRVAEAVADRISGGAGHRRQPIERDLAQEPPGVGPDREPR